MFSQQGVMMMRSRLQQAIHATSGNQGCRLQAMRGELNFSKAMMNMILKTLRQDSLPNMMLWLLVEDLEVMLQQLKLLSLDLRYYFNF